MFQTVTTTYAVLALIADGLVLLTLLGFVVSRFSANVRLVWDRFRDVVAPIALVVAFVVAVLAMSGSLYLSEVVHLNPCHLCWYQRIAMYPMVLLLGIAVVRNDLYTARRYMAPLAFVGAIIATYHYQLERFPSQVALACGPDALCSIPAVNVWGFNSVPFWALGAFLLIGTVLVVARERD